MTETPDLIARLRTCAAGLCVADHDEFTAAETAAPDLLGAAADHIDMLLKSMESLRDAHLAEHEAAGRAEDARRRFLEAAVCHPGPPMSETEDYDPDADLSDLEGSVLERMDMETRWHRELMEIRREAEGILARTPDPSRSTVQAFKDLLAHFAAFHQHLEERVTAANEQVDSTSAATFDVEPAGNAVAEHIRAAGGDPEAATVAQIADALNDTNYFGGVTVPNEAGNGLEHTPDQRGVAVKLQWDSPDTFEVAPPKRITIDLRRPETPPTPEEEAENAAYMARIMEGVKQAVARPEWPLMPVEIVMRIGFTTFKPEATSVIWAGQIISTGDADLSLQMEDPVHELSVFNFEDSMGRVRKQSGKGRLWLALDDAAAERLGHYRGAGLDGPVSLILLWPSSDAMRFEVRLGDAPDNLTPPAQSPGERRQWYGYRIEVCPYPGPAADLFQARNRP